MAKTIFSISAIFLVMVILCVLYYHQNGHHIYLPGRSGLTDIITNDDIATKIIFNVTLFKNISSCHTRNQIKNNISGTLENATNGSEPDHTIFMTSRGRLGNLMSQISALYAAGKRTCRTTLYIFTKLSDARMVLSMFPQMPSFVNVYFKNTKSNAMEKDFLNYMSELPRLVEEEVYKKEFPASDVYICCYTQFIKFWNDCENDIKQMFTFSQHLRKKAYLTLRKIQEKSSAVPMTNVTYVGIHIRRGDKARHPRYAKRLPKPSFIHHAIQYAKATYCNVTFIVASDSIDWCIENFKSEGIYFLQGHTAEEDLVTLALCDHIIITSGTFSFWAGMLVHWNGGEVIYPGKTRKTHYPPSGHQLHNSK